MSANVTGSDGVAAIASQLCSSVRTPPPGEMNCVRTFRL